MSKLVRIRQYGDPIQTMDSARKVRDQLLTTEARLNAEAAPGAPDLGVLYTGNFGGGTLPEPSLGDSVRDVEASGAFVSPEDQAAIRAILEKYSGSASGRTNRAGVSTPDSRTAALDAVKQVRANMHHLKSIQDANDSFWKDRVAALQG